MLRAFAGDGVVPPASSPWPGGTPHMRSNDPRTAQFRTILLFNKHRVVDTNSPFVQRDPRWLTDKRLSRILYVQSQKVSNVKSELKGFAISIQPLLLRIRRDALACIQRLYKFTPPRARKQQRRIEFRIKAGIAEYSELAKSMMFGA